MCLKHKSRISKYKAIVHIPDKAVEQLCMQTIHTTSIWAPNLNEHVKAQYTQEKNL